MAEEIKKYLESEDRDYNLGLVLLSKISKNRTLVANLGRKKNVKKLEYELGKSNAREQKIIDAVKAVKSAKTRANKIKKMLPENEAEAKALLDFVTDEELKELDWKTQIQPLRKLVTGEGKSKAAVIAALIKFKHPKVDAPVVPENVKTSTESGSEDKKEGVSRVRIVRGNQKVSYDDLPKEFQERWDQNADAYKEERSLHEKLKLMKDAKDEDRAPIIQRIEVLSMSIRANWDAIDGHFAAKNEKGNKAVDAPKKIDNKRINSNRKFISTNLPKLERSPRNFTLKAKIQTRIDELIAVEENFKDGYLKKLTALGLRTTTENSQ